MPRARHGPPTKRQQTAEVLALRMLGDDAKQIVTIRTVQTKMAALRSHGGSCACGLCRLAAEVPDAAVFRVIATWQAQLARTRELRFQ